MIVAWFICALLILSGCGENFDTSDTTDAADVSAIAARSAVRAWAISGASEVRKIDVAGNDLSERGADVQVTFDVRVSPSGAWESLSILLPVGRNASNGWTVPSTLVVDRLIVSALAARALASPRATATPVSTATPTPPLPTSTPEPPQIPAPPDGDILYTSDWSAGLDDWIGPSEWSVVGGRLVNDGSRQGRDPWIEAPVRVEPWQSMIIEVQIEAPASDYGSFGLIARSSGDGSLALGMRWQQAEDGSGMPMVTLGATIRRDMRRVEEEWFTVPYALTSGPHLYRFEFLDGEISMFIDNVEVGEIQDGTFATGEFIGLWSEQTPLQVDWFRVTVV